MKQIPLTYLFDFAHCSEQLRPYIMAEFASNGAKHLVLSNTLISMIMQNSFLAAQLKKEIAAAGMSFVDAHAPFGHYLDLNVPDPQYRGIMLARMQLALQIAADFAIDSIAIHSGDTPEIWKNYSLTQLHEALIDSLETLLPLAEKLKITIALENIIHPSNTAEKLLAAVKRFSSPFIALCYDSGHANLMKMDRGFNEGQALEAWKNHGKVQWDDKILEKMLPEVSTCHLHDNHGQYDNHLIPGKGNIDWQHCLGLLKKAPKLKCIQCETIPVFSQSPIAEICKTMKKMLA
jgi:sugar phosphate isomerase/epimerase